LPPVGPPGVWALLIVENVCPADWNPAGSEAGSALGPDGDIAVFCEHAAVVSIATTLVNTNHFE
jgi:hypothetical protein